MKIICGSYGSALLPSAENAFRKIVAAQWNTYFVRTCQELSIYVLISGFGPHGHEPIRFRASPFASYFWPAVKVYVRRLKGFVARPLVLPIYQITKRYLLHSFKVLPLRSYAKFQPPTPIFETVIVLLLWNTINNHLNSTCKAFYPLIPLSTRLNLFSSVNICGIHFAVTLRRPSSSFRMC
jgi:hypothetical protein